jgi:hypothetical protein
MINCLHVYRKRPCQMNRYLTKLPSIESKSIFYDFAVDSYM